MGTDESSGNSRPASRLIDGLGLDGNLFNEEGCAHTSGCGLIANEWFSLELPVSRKITRIQIANRVDCTSAECKQRANNVRITIGPSKAYDPNEPLCLPEIPALVWEPGLQDYSCTGDLHEGRFVKISRAGCLNLCEVQVFTAQSTGGKEVVNTLSIN